MKKNIKLKNNKKDVPKIITFINYNNEKIPQKLYKSFKVYTDNIPFPTIHFLSKVSDFLIVLSLENPEKIEILKSYSNLIFCYSEDKKAIFKNFIKENKYENRLVSFENLANYLNSLKIRKRLHRPYMVPDTVDFDGEYLNVSGYLFNNLSYNKVICNGMYEFLVDSVVIDGKILRYEDFKGNEVLYETIDLAKEGFFEENDQDFDIDSESDEFRDVNINNDNRNSDFDDNNLDELLEKYKEYDNTPKINKNLIFIKNLKSVENRIIKQKGIGNCFLTLKLKKNFDEKMLNMNNFVFEKGLLVIFGMYFLEDQKTLFHTRFSLPFSINENTKYFIDIGHRIIEANPILCDGNNELVRRNELNTGNMVFIAPITFLRSRMIFFPHIENPYKNTIITNSPIFENKTVYDEIIFSGYPININGNFAKIKGMFTTKKEVDFFKNKTIDSKGIKGIIKKSVGMKGNFKAYFEKQIKHGDPVTLKIYKSVEFFE